MTTDLFYLALTAGLCAFLWMPYIIGYVVTGGPLTPQEYRDGAVRQAPAWIARAERTHMNLVENIGHFAALVLIAHVSGEANSTTAIATTAFFWFRIGHATVHIAGIPYIRTLIYLFGFAAEVVILVQILT